MNATPTRDELRNAICDMENPLHEARNLAFAVEIMASGLRDFSGPDVQEAFATVSIKLCFLLDDLKGQRDEVMRLAAVAA